MGFFRGVGPDSRALIVGKGWYAVNNQTISVYRRLTEAWQNVRSNMRRMSSASDVRPTDPHRIFRVGAAADGVVTCTVGPVVFRVPERAGHGVPNLYIAVSGQLGLPIPTGKDAPLRIASFGTRVGYFRQREQTLEHVYGVHYDCTDQQVGHPFFHAQMAPQTAFVGDINDHFRQNLEVRNYVERVLGTVRSPSAEMDVFSVFLQICADHLVWKGSRAPTTRAFARMRDLCGSFGGVADAMPHFRSPSPCRYRSPRWYT